MKKQMLLLLVILQFTFSCKKDSIETETLRPFIQLSDSDIPVLREMKQYKGVNGDIGVYGMYDNTFVATQEFKWNSIDSSHVNVMLWITESRSSAIEHFNFLKDFFAIKNSKMDGMEDKPSVAGEISFNHGMSFLRDNIIVRIWTSDNYIGSIPEIAEDFDEKILHTQTFFSLDQVKPTIKVFKLNENPMPKDTTISYTILANGPNDGWISHEIMFLEDTRTKGVFLKSGGLHYDSKIADSTKTQFGLTLVAISQYGFCADSTIYIKVKN